MLEQLKQNLKDTREIADELEIPLILDCGSLLGVYRDGGVIKGDEDDVDFAVPYDVAEFKMLKIIRAFEKRGFELHRLRPTVITMKRGGSKIDFLFYRELEDEYYITLYHNKRPFGLLTKKHQWDNLGLIDYYGVTFLCPEDIEAHLAFRYGKDWRTPKLRPAFSFEDYTKQESFIWLT